jgi:hypothetical protein
MECLVYLSQKEGWKSAVELCAEDCACAKERAGVGGDDRGRSTLTKWGWPFGSGFDHSF